MTDWQSYSLSDFLLFSPRAYYRLFERVNEALWPGPLVAYALGLLLLWLIWQRSSSGHRAATLILGLAWCSSGWFFLWQHYATINWAIIYVAPLFWLQGAVLILLSAFNRGLDFQPVRTGTILVLYSALAAVLLASPLVAPVSGRPLAAGEVFGIAANPTALSTLLALFLAKGWGRWVLFILPLVWCALSVLTLWALHGQSY